MYLLPKMGPEDLNQGDLERWNLAVQEDTSQVQLHLETDVDVCSVNGLQQKSVYRTIVFMGRLTERRRPQKVVPEETVQEDVVPLETISVETIPLEMLPEEAIPQEAVRRKAVPQ